MGTLRSKYSNETGTIATFKDGVIYDGGSTFNNIIGRYNKGSVYLTSSTWGSVEAIVENGKIYDMSIARHMIGYCENGKVYDAHFFGGIVAYYDGDDIEGAAAAAYIKFFANQSTNVSNESEETPPDAESTPKTVSYGASGKVKYGPLRKCVYSAGGNYILDFLLVIIRVALLITIVLGFFGSDEKMMTLAIVLAVFQWLIHN